MQLSTVARSISGVPPLHRAATAHPPAARRQLRTQALFGKLFGGLGGSGDQVSPSLR
jgi:hypothetical protein